MGAALEFVKNGVNGWLIHAGDEEALLEAMREAALMPAGEIAGLGRAARESVSRHTLQRGAVRFVEYAQQVIARW
jgi:glycosyltransferase involved in cell wall biosynthesis